MKDLKVSYQRNLKSNWLIFEPEESFLSELSNKYAFEMGMIEHNNIRGFLRPDIKRVNSKIYAMISAHYSRYQEFLK